MYVVWRRPDDSLYYRLVKGTYKRYYVGYHNQYDHEVMLIIDLPQTKLRYNHFRYHSRKFLKWLYYKI